MGMPLGAVTVVQMGKDDDLIRGRGSRDFLSRDSYKK